MQARKALPNEPLTHLLRAQAAQMSGDRTTSRRIFEAMLGSPDTEQLGLRGLYLEAEREGEREAARQFAERAIEAQSEARLVGGCAVRPAVQGERLGGALETLAIARQHAHHREGGSRSPARGAADGTGAGARGERSRTRDEPGARSASSRARSRASRRHRWPHAGRARQHASARRRSSSGRGAQSPHPDLALVYAYARIGDSPRDRLDRVKQLAQLNAAFVESADRHRDGGDRRPGLGGGARGARAADAERLTQRVCTLMARIEGEEHGDKGRVREWLARAVNAPRDPAWTADGVVADRWAPVSPVTARSMRSNGGFRWMRWTRRTTGLAGGRSWKSCASSARRSRSSRL